MQERDCPKDLDRDIVALARQNFHANQNATLRDDHCNFDQILPISPCLVRNAHCPDLFANFSNHHDRRKSEIRTILMKYYPANSVTSYLTCDFVTLESDLSKERKIAKKNLAANGFIDSGQNKPGSFSRFESSADVQEKFGIILSELSTNQLICEEKSSACYLSRKFEPLDNPMTFEECCHMFSIAVAEMPGFMCIETMCECLLRYKFGSQAIQRLLVNFHEKFCDVCFYLVNSSDAMDLENAVTRRRLESLEGLCALNPDAASTLAIFCLRSGKLISFLFFCGYKFLGLDTMVSLLCGALFGSNVRERISVVQFVQHAQKQQLTTAIASSAWNSFKIELLKTIQKLASDLATLVDSDQIQRCINLLRLICGLRALANAKFSEEEVKQTFLLVTLLPHSPCNLSSTLISYQLCYLISFPPSGSQNTQYDSIVVWLKNLMQMQKEYDSVPDNYVKTLQLIAISFHTNQIVTLSQIVSNLFRIKIQTKSNHFNRLKIIFTNDLYSEQVITQNVSEIAVSKKLSSTSQGCLPIHCVQQLLTNRTFSKHRVSIKQWILAQLKECSLPIHSAVPSLLEAYASSCIVPASKGSISNFCTDSSIDEMELKTYFEHDCFDKSSLTFKILLFYYALIFEELRTTNLRMSVVRKWKTNPSRCVKLLEKALAAPDIILNANFSRFCYEFCQCCPTMLEISVPLKIVNLYVEMISLLARIHPIQLYTSLICSLLPESLFTHKKHFSHESLCNDPLVILRTDERLFRCAPLLNCVLRILRCYLSASQSKLHRELAQAAIQAGDSTHKVENSLVLPHHGANQMAEAEREELARALIGAQESAAVQILLEACLPNGRERNQKSNLTSLREIQSLICSHLHQMFIDNPLLMKLVHFQGYPHQLVPLTVTGIPSVHICLDFIPEMLSQPDHSKRFSAELEKYMQGHVKKSFYCSQYTPILAIVVLFFAQIFAIVLLSHLAQQYTIPKAYSCAKLSIAVLHTLLPEIFSPMTNTVQRLVAQRNLLLSKAKLKASSRTSALLAGFAMVALVELDLVDKSGSPSVTPGVIIAFGVCTTLLVSVHLLALMMSTCILPYMEASHQQPQDIFSSECDDDCDSLLIRMRWYIELSWFFSTVLGLLLFLLEICIIFWIKFVAPSNSTAAYITTGLLMPVFAVFLWFTYTFYRRLTLHKYEVTKNRLNDLENYCTRLNEFESVTVALKAQATQHGASRDGRKPQSSRAVSHGPSDPSPGLSNNGPPHSVA